MRKIQKHRQGDFQSVSDNTQIYYIDRQRDRETDKLREIRHRDITQIDR